MVIPVISACHFPVKPGIGSYIDLASENRIDPLLTCLPIKIDHSVHDSVIRNCRTVHPQLFHSCNILFDLVRAIQKTVLRMDM